MKLILEIIATKQPFFSNLKEFFWSGAKRFWSGSARARPTVTPPLEPSDEYSLQMENAALMGIPKCLKCLNIAIVGGGVAGLTSAVELSLAGHNVIIYEGSSRPGGRVLTYRHPTGDYMTELGAMRLPLDVHTLLKTYIQQRFNLPIAEFHNTDDHTLIYLNNVHATTADANIRPSTFNFNVNDNEYDKVSL